MSATNRGRKRVANDQYETPTWTTRRALDALDLPGGHWLEPGCASGSIIRTVNRWRDDVVWHSVELRKVVPLAQHHFTADFLKWKPDRRRYDVIMGNPPYKLAEEFVKRALELAPIVVFLLRVGFLESDTRADWLRSSTQVDHGSSQIFKGHTSHTPTVNVLPNRPSFRWKGSDASAYAWMEWRNNAKPTVRVLERTPIFERKCCRVEDRDVVLFWKQVELQGECWLWKGPIDADRRPRIVKNGMLAILMAQRAAGVRPGQHVEGSETNFSAQRCPKWMRCVRPDHQTGARKVG